MWKACVPIGSALLTLGLAAFSIDERWDGQFDFIGRHLTVFGFAILFGLLCLVAGLIGWATQLDRRGRVRVAKFALLLPLFVLIVAGYSSELGVHGVFPLFLISMAPVMLVGLIVVFMAVKAPA